MSQIITDWDASAVGNQTLVSGRRAGTGAEGRGLPISGEGLRVEAVDTNHPAWGEVRGAIVRAGNGRTLMLNDHGRLSARQTVLAAFARDQVIGHLCFSIEPARSGVGRATVSAKLDSFAVDEAFAGTVVESLLTDTAEERARLMKCRGPRVNAVVMC